MATPAADRILATRRYDLFKLGVALALFVVWLFLVGRPPQPPAPVAETASVRSGPALPSRLRFELGAGRIRIAGRLPDAASRDALLASVSARLGGAAKLVDALEIDPAVAAPGWLARTPALVAALAGYDGLTISVDGQQVVLEGVVPDEPTRSRLADTVTAAFGAPFTVENRVSLAALPPPVAIVPAPVSLSFAEGSVAPAQDAAERLGPLVRFASGSPDARIVVSGYHSATGSLERNLEIAKQRALAVRDLLVSLGLPEQRVRLERPRQTLGEADADKARRVDVGVED